MSYFLKTALWMFVVVAAIEDGFIFCWLLQAREKTVNPDVIGKGSE